jgi:hypothetical protein
VDNDFAKKLDDIVREELATMGYDYRDYIVAVEHSRSADSAVVRFHPPYDDVEIDGPHDGEFDAKYSAKVRRRLKVAIDAPERPAAPPESV